MQFPLSWLAEYIETDLSIEALADVLTCAGLEVEGVASAPLTFSGVIAAHIESVAPHPDADSLRIATVSKGSETTTVVCGAPNCAAGMTVPFAPIGARIDGKKMKKGKFRGVVSHGMLCGADELGLATHSDGLMELDLPVGTDLATHFGDTIIDLSLTPNLGHCASLVGIARELSALTDTPYTAPTSPPLPSKTGTITISREDETACPCYAYCLIEGVAQTPSPEWMTKRLTACGIRPISLIVDITNYVMLELGQPMHAFDFDSLPHKELRIAPAPSPTQLETLDGATRTVPEGTLLIWDRHLPIAIAGVMGGAQTEVTTESKTILLEAAHFAPPSVRAASKGTAVRTESSSRFEKGVDPTLPERALARCAYLIAELAGGKAIAADRSASPIKEKRLSLRTQRVSDLLGISLTTSEIETLLRRLEMKPRVEGETLLIDIPHHRLDIRAEIDLIEEVGRLYGYNQIPRKAPRVTTSPLADAPLFSFERLIRRRCLAAGLAEFLTCDLIHPDRAQTYIEHPLTQEALIHVLKPSSIDQSTLRPSLLPGLLESVAHNLAHKEPNIAAFEIGAIHYKQGEAFSERLSLGIVVTGSRSPHFWGGEEAPFDFYDLKGLIESALPVDFTFTPSSLETLHPGIQAALMAGERHVGTLGHVHPTLLQGEGIDTPLFFAHIDLLDLLDVWPQDAQMRPLPIYPGSERDWTLSLATELPVGRLIEAIKGVPSKLLKSVEVRDIYRGKEVGETAHNVTVRLTYRDDKETVKHERVEKEHARICNAAVDSPAIQPYVHH
jgi:phenylalanyl-tRNA synthetase beta chain